MTAIRFRRESRYMAIFARSTDGRLVAKGLLDVCSDVDGGSDSPGPHTNK